MIAKIALLILTGTATAASLVAVRQARLQAVAEMTAALKESHRDDLEVRRVRAEIMGLTSIDRAWAQQARFEQTHSIQVPRWDASERVLVLAKGWPLEHEQAPAQMELR